MSNRAYIRSLQQVINDLRPNDLPYGHLITEALQIIENRLQELER